jgi:hypothetical protein
MSENSAARFFCFPLYIFSCIDDFVDIAVYLPHSDDIKSCRYFSDKNIELCYNSELLI